MFRATLTGTWRAFLAGMLCGTALTAGAVLGWWKLSMPAADFSERYLVPIGKEPAAHDPTYDSCLLKYAGDKAGCDAMMRLLSHPPPP
jgi:hypothetical protein